MEALKCLGAMTTLPHHAVLFLEYFFLLCFYFFWFLFDYFQLRYPFFSIFSGLSL